MDDPSKLLSEIYNNTKKCNKKMQYLIYLDGSKTVLPENHPPPHPISGIVLLSITICSTKKIAKTLCITGFFFLPDQNTPE
jgi:hypothetical protein